MRERERYTYVNWTGFPKNIIKCRVYAFLSCVPTAMLSSFKLKQKKVKDENVLTLYHWEGRCHWINAKLWQSCNGGLFTEPSLYCGLSNGVEQLLVMECVCMNYMICNLFQWKKYMDVPLSKITNLTGQSFIVNIPLEINYGLFFLSAVLKLTWKKFRIKS